MPKIEEGQRFGRLTVIEKCPNQRGARHPKYRCLCDCGKETLVQRDNFARTNSCGCLRAEQLVARSKTHGMSSTPEFKAWTDMRERCYRQTRKDFDHYGGRGIRVCQRWLDGFEPFFADMGSRPEAHSLDRIDPNGDYEPSNCRWATASTQRINQRRMRS